MRRWILCFMKRIPLGGKHGKGRFVLVDDKDYEWLSRWRWYTKRDDRTLYAWRSTSRKDGRKSFPLFIHRILFGLYPGDGLIVDHINHDGLDNRRSNLRICTNSQNQLNRRGRQSNNKSGHPGVFWRKRDNRWTAAVKHLGKKNYLGNFVSKSAAIRAVEEFKKKIRSENPMIPSEQTWEQEFASLFFERINNRVLDQDIESFIRRAILSSRHSAIEECIKVVENTDEKYKTTGKAAISLAKRQFKKEAIAALRLLREESEDKKGV